MPELTISNVDRHWAWNSKTLRSEYGRWINLFDESLMRTSALLTELEGRRALAENCSYLLLSKATNHILGMWSLINHGLIIDASLCVRNAVETLLLLQICLLDPKEEYFEHWMNGKEFKPAWVRKQLDLIKEVHVRDIIYSQASDEDGENSFIYGWLSKITHANVESLSHSMRVRGANSFEVIIGGDTLHTAPIINTLFAISLSKLIFTELLCASVLRLEWLEERKEWFNSLNKKIHALANEYRQQI